MDNYLLAVLMNTRKHSALLVCFVNLRSDIGQSTGPYNYEHSPPLVRLIVHSEHLLQIIRVI